MATPSEKAPAIEALLGNRKAIIQADQCVFGCGPATQFRDELSKREYTISGMCQKCQDKVFGLGDE